MRYTFLFRLMLKAIGIWFLVQGGSQLLSFGTVWIENIIRGIPFGITGLSWIVGKLFELLVGAYLFWGGSWIVEMAIPKDRQYCPKCGNEIKDIEDSTCTYCGALIGHDE